MAYFAVAQCFACNRTFSFNPNRVPSYSGPQTNHERVPICQSCMAVANRHRIARGEEPHPILPGAYDPEPEERDTDRSGSHTGED